MKETKGGDGRSIESIGLRTRGIFVSVVGIDCRALTKHVGIIDLLMDQTTF
jgi:hypothetical protein